MINCATFHVHQHWKNSTAHISQMKSHEAAGKSAKHIIGISSKFATSNSHGQNRQEEVTLGQDFTLTAFLLRNFRCHYSQVQFSFAFTLFSQKPKTIELLEVHFTLPKFLSCINHAFSLLGSWDHCPLISRGFLILSVKILLLFIVLAEKDEPLIYCLLKFIILSSTNLSLYIRFTSNDSMDQ